MAAHRYWRLLSLKNNGGTCTTITELIMATTPGGATICTGGTPIKSSEQAGWEASKAFDGVSGDQGWASAVGDIAGAWIGYDLGAGNSADVVEVRVMSRTNGSGLLQSPALFFIQFSDDGVEWSQRGGSSGLQTGWTANQTRTFNIGSADTISTGFIYLEAVGTSRSASLRTHRPSSFKLGTTGGSAKFAGTIATGTAPIDGVVVKVFDALSLQPAGEVVSNSIGEWEITGLRENREYFLVAANPDNLWEYTVSSRRTPSHDAKLGGRATAGERSTVLKLVKSDPYRYIKLNATAVQDAGTYVNLGAIRLVGLYDQNLCRTVGGSATQSSSFSAAYTSFEAFTETASFWHTASQSAPWWATWDFGSGNAQYVDRVILRGFNVAGRQPKDFTIEGSNDGTTWTVLGTWTGEVGWDVSTEREFGV